MKEDKNLFATFPVPSREEWEALANSETGEGKTIDSLRWATPDGLTFEPIYTSDDVEGLSHSDAFQFKSEGIGSNVRQWENTPEVIVKDERTANAEALEHLQHEAGGILFNLEKEDVDFKMLLGNIEWHHCHISFLSNSRKNTSSLLDFISKSKFDKNKISGAWFAENALLSQSIIDKNVGLKLLGIAIRPSTSINEIVEALKTGVKIIDQHLKNGYAASQVISSVAFSLPVGPNFMEEIAKLKVLRRLWYQVARAYEVESFTPDQLYLHGRSEVWINEKFQPHGNMLKSTVAGIAAICGGCNAVTIRPEEPGNTVMRRIARNTSALLLEESQLGKVQDPVAGAYVIEAMVERMSREAWEKFRKEM